MVRCEIWARKNMVVHAPKVVHSATELVVHNPVGEVVHAEPSAAVVVHESKHGKYADAEKRKAYRREWMRIKRSSGGDS